MISFVVTVRSGFVLIKYKIEIIIPNTNIKKPNSSIKLLNGFNSKLKMLLYKNIPQKTKSEDTNNKKKAFILLE